MNKLMVLNLFTTFTIICGILAFKNYENIGDYWTLINAITIVAPFVIGWLLFYDDLKEKKAKK